MEPAKLEVKEASPSTSEKKDSKVLGDPEQAASDATKQNVEPEPPFSIFSVREKKFIVFMASLAALFSPLSANIYYPALTILATDLNVSYTLINLTITSYLILQGLAPTFIGNISDETGRRPSYLICFVIYIGANIGLALQNNYAALFLLRCLQSSGSSGTVALATAIVADLVTSAERGTYIGYATVGALLGPAVGPIIGGLLCQYIGWRSVFWFLTIFGSVVVIIFIIVLPETCRKVVGNGSIPPQKWNISVLTYINLRRQRQAGLADTERRTVSHKVRASPFNSVKIILDKESGLLLLFAGTIYAGYYMVITAVPSQFKDKYGFDTLQIGFCYLPAGIGGMLAVLVTGRFIDWNFRRHAKKLGLKIDKQKQQELRDFPIETARLQIVAPLIALGGAILIVFGFILEYQVSPAAPLVLLFLSTFCLIGAFNGLSALVIDLNRSSPGTATAAMNLVRCWMGAGGVAAVIPIIERIGTGWTSVVVVASWALCIPVIFIVMRFGPKWREEKRIKEEKKANDRDSRRQATVELERGGPKES